MSSINQKLGIRPAGRRRMMALPTDRAAAADLTAAKCPDCGQRGVIQHVIHGKKTRMCSWCSATWTVDEVPHVD